jgi:hypothetical protein
MFKPGQKIVCVDNTPRDDRAITIAVLSQIKVGETYTVREIFDSTNPGQYSIALEEVSTPFSDRLDHEIGYKADRFRPLDSYQFAEETLNRIAEEIEEELIVKIPK